jgi:hypothetical protein
MDVFTFRDAAGQSWHVIDYRVNLPTGRKMPLPLGSSQADGRAFLPVDRSRPTLIHRFGLRPRHDTAPATLERQLGLARLATDVAAQDLENSSQKG